MSDTPAGRGRHTYALRRFDNEAHRIFDVMNLGLFDKRYLAAGQYTIADPNLFEFATLKGNSTPKVWRLSEGAVGDPSSRLHAVIVWEGTAREGNDATGDFQELARRAGFEERIVLAR